MKSADKRIKRHQSQVTRPKWRQRSTREEVLRRRNEPPPAVSIDHPIRLGAFAGTDGEFVRPGLDPRLSHARELFLEAVKEIEPSVLKDLANEPFAAFYPSFVQVCCTSSIAYVVYPSRLSSWLSPPDEDEPPPLMFGETIPRPAILNDGWEHRWTALNAWAARWNLDRSEDKWCQLTAAKTILNWCQHQYRQDLDLFTQQLERNPDLQKRPVLELDWSSSSSQEPREWCHPVSREAFALPSEEKQMGFPTFEWEPQAERRADAERRIGDDLKRFLSEHLDRIESAAVTEGLVRPTQKDSGTIHFRWFAQWQVQAQSIGEIAREARRSQFGRGGKNGPSRQAVQQAVHNTAQLIGLERRPDNQGGRPRKPRTPHIIKLNRPD